MIYLIRICIVVSFPIICVLVMLERTWTEIKSIPFYIKCDLVANWKDFKKFWNDGKIE